MATPNPDRLVRRRLHDVLAARLTEEPVIALHGPRTVGKSTMLNDFGSRRVDLDDGPTRVAVMSDPELFVLGPAPVCIHEYQHEPELLSAIKAELNRDFRPGRYILTGSTTHASIPLTAQSLAGRLHVITVWPLSQGEIEGTHEIFVDRLFEDCSELVSGPDSKTSREDYVARVVRGGMPLALARSTAPSRGRWFDDYVRLVVERDVTEFSRIKQRESLPLLLKALAAQTAQLLTIRRAAEACGLEPPMVEGYTKLLEAAFLIHRLPSWGRTMSSRIGNSPKVHIFDSGLAARLLGLTPEKLARRLPSALEEFGHLLETFVVNEILKQIGWGERRIDAGHFRTKNGTEVGLVLEADDGSVAGIEVKSSDTVSAADFAGLRSLRTAAGDAFTAGVLLYLGSKSFTLERGLYALPVDRLWTPPQ
jgi:predicted AAA+ superfamily ATPase